MNDAADATSNLRARASFVVPAELRLDGVTESLVVNGDTVRLLEDAGG
jgi:hypothetical protein